MAQEYEFTRKEAQCPLRLMDKDKTCRRNCPLYQENVRETAATNLRILEKKESIRQLLSEMSEEEIRSCLAELKEINEASREKLLIERPDLKILCLRESERS